MNSNSVRFQPLYRQIRDVLYKRIVDGYYRPGVPLPAEPRLAKEFNTSIAPIRQAVSALEADGILKKRQGKGTFLAEKKTTLSMVTYLSAYPAVLDKVNGLLREFERENPLVEINHISVTPAEARDYILSLITNGNSPDVIQLMMFLTSHFAAMGALEPLDTLLDNSTRLLSQTDELHDGIYLNKRYSVPWGLRPFTHFANKSILRECDIQLGPDPITLDEFAGLCRIVDERYKGDPTVYSYGLGITGGYSDFLSIYVYLQAFGGGFINTRDEIIFNSKENVAAFSWLREFIASSRVLISQIDPGRLAFAQGKVAFKTEGPYLKYTIEEVTGQPFDENFQVFLNPVLEKSHPSRSWNNNIAFAISSQSENKLYAARLVDFLTRDSRLHGIYTMTGDLPISEDSLSLPEFQNGFYSVYRKQREHSSVVNAHHYLFEQAMDLCSDSVRRILFSDIEIAKELDEKEYYLNILYRNKKFI